MRKYCESCFPEVEDEGMAADREISRVTKGLNVKNVVAVRFGGPAGGDAGHEITVYESLVTSV